MVDLRVLIVDDEPGMRMGAAKVLGRHVVDLAEIGREIRFAVDTAADGREALAKLEAGGWDLLLLDYKLPDISGLDILEEIRKRGIDVTTVMITAYASLEVAVTATKNGAFDFLAKPFTPDELRSVVGKAARSLALQRRAAKLEREKRQVRFQFISVLAHELKAPLSVVESFMYMMKDRTLGDEVDDYEEMIGRTLVRVEGMRKMIGDLLDLTRMESGQKVRELAELDVAEVAAVCLENVQQQAAERGIEVNSAMDGPLPMLADREEMEIVLNNLLTNAVKYNRDGGRVDLKIELRDGRLVIAVSDTGIGMTAEECGRLFREFSRIKNEKTRRIQGSGLGLSILKKIADLYGGSVSVSSEPDVGSTFTVELGAQAAAPAGATGE